MIRRRIALLVVLLFIFPVLAGCRSVPAHIHTYGDWITVEAATCVSSGYAVRICDCGTAIRRAIPPQPPHEFGPWQIKTPATLDTSGIRYRSCTGCEFIQELTIDPIADHGQLGSAGWIGDDTVIVTVFADDMDTRWPDDQSFLKYRQQAQQAMATAVTWLQAQCAAYGVGPQFYYDWNADPALSYQAVFPNDHFTRTLSSSGYPAQQEWIDTNIDADAIRQRYNAPNIIYVFFFCAPLTERSYALCDLNGRTTECVNMLSRRAPSLAHELLHCFSLPDLYKSNKWITEAYVAHCKTLPQDDIMLSTFDLNSLRISALDAYYLGLIDSHPDVEEWGLGKSRHQS